MVEASSVHSDQITPVGGTFNMKVDGAGHNQIKGGQNPILEWNGNPKDWGSGYLHTM